MEAVGQKEVNEADESKTKKKMKINTINRKDNRIEFNISGITESFANTFRRIVISDIPIMAIETVTFHQNSSVMDDEVLAHRLGLVPLKTDSSGIEEISMTLKATGPKVVYSEELHPDKIKTKGKSKKSESIAAYGKIPLMKLSDGQEIELEAIAQLGTGEEHIKWQGGLASYDLKKDGSFDFFVESYGQRPINELIEGAFDIFDDKIKELKSLL